MKILLALVVALLGTPTLRVGSGLSDYQNEPHAERGATQERVATQFEYLDIFVDSADQPLAAWQVDLHASVGKASIVGIEGGDGIYAPAPYYDEAAMQHDRVILAGLSTLPQAQLPTGKVRVARVHVMIEQPGTEFTISISAAALPDGTRTPATATLERGKAPGATK